MNKKLYVPALFLLAFTMIGTTYAYMTHLRSLSNKMTIANCIIETDEDFTPPDEIIPGTDTIFKKAVRMKNTGNIDCYVRVFFEFSDSKMKDVSSLSHNGQTWFPANNLALNLTNGWVYIHKEDNPLLGGYYYHVAPVSPSDSTSNLIDSVKVSVAYGDAAKNFDILVYGEAVQTKINEGNGGQKEAVEATSYYEAWTHLLEP